LLHHKHIGDKIEPSTQNNLQNIDDNKMTHSWVDEKWHKIGLKNLRSFVAAVELKKQAEFNKNPGRVTCYSRWFLTTG
jgi:hypothetical protein